MAIVNISGAYDMQIHSAPSLFNRIGDDLDFARHAAEAGLAGVLLKNHFESTVGRAGIDRRVIEGTQIWEDLVLNHFTGGLTQLPLNILWNWERSKSGSPPLTP